MARTAGSNSVFCSSLCGPLKKEGRREGEIRGERERGNGSSRFPRKLQGDMKKCTIVVPLLSRRRTEPTYLDDDATNTFFALIFLRREKCHFREIPPPSGRAGEGVSGGGGLGFYFRASLLGKKAPTTGLFRDLSLDFTLCQL